MSDRNTCASCRAFYNYNDGSNFGECRRRAPNMIGNEFWPCLAHFNWCAEHLPNDAIFIRRGDA